MSDPFVTDVCVRSILYKLTPGHRATAIIDQYISDAVPYVVKVANFIRDGLSSRDTVLNEFCVQALKLPAATAAANLAPFFCKTTHGLRDISDVIRTNDDGSTTNVTPPTRLIKRNAVVLREQGVFPFQELLNLKQTVVMQYLFAAFKAVKSWCESDKLTATAYAELNKSITSDLTKAGSSWAGFKLWLDHCESRNYFKLSERIVKYAASSSFRFANDEIIVALNDMFPDWASPFGDDSKLSSFVDLELRCRKLAVAKKNANWTEPSNDTLKLDFLGGLPRFIIDWGTTPLVTVKINDNDVLLSVAGGKHKTGNTSIRNVTSQMVGIAKYAISYDRYGRRLNGVCNNVAVYRRGDDVYLQVVLNTDVPYLGDIAAWNKYLFAHRSVRTEAIQQQTMTIMAVNLGVTKLASFAVMDRTDGVIKKVLSGEVDTVVSHAETTALQLIDKINTIRRELRQSITDQREILSKCDGESKKVKAALQVTANIMKNEFNKLQRLFAFRGLPNNVWIRYVVLIRELRKALVSLSNAGGVFYKNRRTTVSKEIADKLREDDLALAAQNTRLREAGLPEQQIKEPTQEVLFPTLLRQYNNFKDNLLKKLAYAIAMKAKHFGVSVVILDNLEYLSQSSSREPELNELLSLWSHRTLVTKITQALMIHGIACETVDSAYVSQRSPVTREFGYRQQTNRKKLWVRHNNEIVSIDADLAAAENLGYRYLSQYADLCTCRVVPVGDKLLPVMSGRKKIGTRVQNGLQVMVNSRFAVLVPSGSAFVFEAVTEKAYEKMLASVADKQVATTTMFLHDGVFVDRKTHYELVNEIARRAIVNGKSVLETDSEFFSSRFRPRRTPNVIG